MELEASHAYNVSEFTWPSAFQPRDISSIHITENGTHVKNEPECPHSNDRCQSSQFPSLIQGSNLLPHPVAYNSSQNSLLGQVGARTHPTAVVTLPCTW